MGVAAMPFTDADRLKIIGEWNAQKPGVARAAVADKYKILGATIVRWKRRFSKDWRLAKVRQ